MDSNLDRPRIVAEDPDKKPAHDPTREIWGSIDRIHKRMAELEKRQDKVEDETFSNSPAGQNIGMACNGA